jgi:hypothetical protein
MNLDVMKAIAEQRERLAERRHPKGEIPHMRVTGGGSAATLKARSVRAKAEAALAERPMGRTTESLRAQWMGNHQGLANAHRVAFIEGSTYHLSAPTWSGGASGMPLRRFVETGIYSPNHARFIASSGGWPDVGFNSTAMPMNSSGEG